jgi:hypothetical protein
MDEPRLEHPTIKVRELIEDYRNGKIVIPEFQREYVWKRSKAPKLIDSLYQGFPISSLLVWLSIEATRARRADPRPKRGGTVSWLIDGQQRVITLARSMSGDQGIDVVFNPIDEQFRLSNAATKKDRNWFRLADLWDDDMYRTVRRNLPEGAAGERIEKRFDRLRKVLDYEVPLVRMVDHSFSAAVKAFTRINTLGVRLKKEDIESAEVAAKHTGFIADEVSPFLDEIRRSGFVRMNIMHLFRACAFVSRPDGRDRTPLHELERTEVQEAWRKTKRATEEAIGLVRSEFGLINMDVLWSGALLVPVIAICAATEPRKRDTRGLAAWMALAALTHRYSSSSETALDQDLRACRGNDPIGSLLTNLREERSSLVAEADDFAGSLADRSGLFASYIACLHRGILDFYGGGKIVLQKEINRHHILPRGQFDEKERGASDCVANIAFIGGAVNKALGLTGPEVYLKQMKPEIRKSQCIPDDVNLWSIERSTDFWNVRRELLADSFNEFVRAGLPGRRV